MRTPEGEVKAKLKKWLAERGAYQFWPVQGALGKRGVDCYACVAGDFLALECKAYGEKPTKLQRKLLRDVVKAQGTAIIVSVDQKNELTFEVIRVL